MLQQLQASKGNTTTLCFDIPSDLAFRFKKKANKEGETEESLLDSILTEYLSQSDDESQLESGIDKRRQKRVDVSIKGIMEITMPHKETQYKAVKIHNISSGGIGMVISCDSSVVIENLKKGSAFVVIFSVPSLTNIFKILCKPVHVTANLATTIGASFVKLPAALANTLQVHFGL